MTPETQAQDRTRTIGRHAIVGQLRGFDDLAGEVTVYTDQGKKITCTRVAPALMEVLASRVRKVVCLVGFGTWGGNGGLSDFRPVQVLEFDDGLADPAVELTPEEPGHERA